jgi:hypothetical protein
MGRPPSDEKQRQFAFALSPRLREYVEAMAKARDRSVAEEIRTRLAQTVELEEGADQHTIDLMNDIPRLAKEIELETGASWYAHPGSYLAFRQAILSRLARLKPEGAETSPFGKPPPSFGERPHQSGPGDDPQQIGMWAEYRVWTTRDATPDEYKRLREAQEQSWREIVKLQRQSDPSEKTS